jgi:DNA repair protein RecO (recombination protein O)
MNPKQRIHQAPAFVLHRRSFRDSSQIIEVFGREHGRVAMVARGVRSARSRYRGILQPFAPLRLSWVAGRDLGTLTDAEAAAAAHVLAGDALLGGFYVNELLLKLTHRHDPQPSLYDLYAGTIAELAGGRTLPPALRRFESALMRMLGYGLNLVHEADTGRPVEPGAVYRFVTERGPIRMAPGEDGGLALRGEELLRIEAGEFEDQRLCALARQLFADAIDSCLDGKVIESRRIMRSVYRRRQQE